jgi:thiol-disulfide isomerase/thioredoxin
MRKPVSRTPPWVAPVATLGGLAVVIGAFLLYRYATTPPPLPPASAATTAAVVTTITSLPASYLEPVGQGSATNVLKKTSDPLLTDAGGKPIVFYFGAEYCPYCAAERWPMIVALSRFGTFTGLATTSSSPSDVYPNTPTFTFRNAMYTSDYIVFQSVESSDRNGNPLQTPSAAQQALIVKYDTANTIPFLTIGNRFVLLQPSYSPDTLSGMTWSQVATALTNSDSAEAQAIIGSANQLTAAICSVTSNQPSTVCTPAIQAIEAKL